MFKKVKRSIKAPEVILVRHGATAFNNPDKTIDRIRGWQNIPLSDEGCEDAKKAAKDVKKYEIDKIYSSDLIRAVETAEIIKALDFPDVDIHIKQSLRPWHLGIYEGKITANVLDDLNKLVEDENIKAPQGESFKSFRERYLNEIREIVKQAVKYNKQILVTTHFRNLKCANGWIENGAPSDLTVDKKVMITDTFKVGEAYRIDIKKVMMNV